MRGEERKRQRERERERESEREREREREGRYVEVGVVREKAARESRTSVRAKREKKQSACVFLKLPFSPPRARP